ncbi:hypothetical protein [Bacillus paramycoides]|uniref:hypothetical protein n=1 Tax=Bacillus paramycoides TaxID=2026194 RepID=UPI00382E7ED9
MNKTLKFTQMMIGISTMALSFGSIQTQVSAEEKAPYNMLQMKPIGTETLKDGIYAAKPGKYYLNVYKFDDKNGEYSLLVE